MRGLKSVIKVLQLIAKYGAFLSVVIEIINFASEKFQALEPNQNAK